MHAELKYEELIQRSPVNWALDMAFVEKLLVDILTRHYPHSRNLTLVKTETYKRRVGQYSSTYIYGMTFHGQFSDGASFEKELIYSAHTDGSRERAHRTMRTLLDLDFNHDEYRIIEPLEYRADYGALIYEAVKGITLFNYMQAHAPEADLSAIIVRAALWLKKFHSFSVPPENQSVFSRFDFRTIVPDVAAFIATVREADADQGEKIRAFFKTFETLDRDLKPFVTESLVYGDFHPENIIVQSPHDQGLTMIDLVDAGLGDPMRDVGSFLQQVNFMGRQFASSDPVHSLQTSFLNAYFGHDVNELPLSTIQRINLYQAWNALRGFVWFFWQREHRIKSYGILEDAWRYLGHARDQAKTLAIKY